MAVPVQPTGGLPRVRVEAQRAHEALPAVGVDERAEVEVRVVGAAVAAVTVVSGQNAVAGGWTAMVRRPVLR